MSTGYSSFAIVMWMPWTVSLHPQAEAEFRRIPVAERAAVLNAAQKLEALGPDLGYPHSSAVRDADRIRELRPRAGRSPWRGVYRRVGNGFVLAAIGPEAEADPRGSKRGVLAAEERREEVEGGTTSQTAWEDRGYRPGRRFPASRHSHRPAAASCPNRPATLPAAIKRSRRRSVLAVGTGLGLGPG